MRGQCATTATEITCRSRVRHASRLTLPSRLPRADPTTLVMNVPFTGVQFAVYESAKRALVASNVLSSEEEEGLLEQLVAGGAAGGLAAAVTNPLVRTSPLARFPDRGANRRHALRYLGLY